MSAKLWTLFLVTTTLASLAPGPAVLSTVAISLTAGAKRAMWMIAGILAANLVYFAAAALGLKILFATSETLFTAIKWAGALYLIWLGGRLLFGRAETLNASGRAERALPTAGKLFRGGFLLQAANPKAYLYVVAILPPFIDAAAPIIPQMAIIVPTAMIAEWGVLGGYAHIASRMRQLTLGSQFVGLANRAAGIMLVSAGLLVAGFLER